MSLILRLAVFFLEHYAKNRMVSEAKRRGALAYLRAVQGARVAVIAALLSFLFLQLMILSFVGLLVTGVLLWNHDFEAKIEVLFWIFTGMFSVPALILIALLSERFWFKASGAEKIVRALTPSASSDTRKSA